MWTFHPTNKAVLAHIKKDGELKFSLHAECTHKEGIAVVEALNKGIK